MNYYTPSIEEFHVGFEFEFFHIQGTLLNSINDIKEWRNTTCDPDWFNILLNEYEHNPENIADTFRVKYLGRAGICSLGWNFEKSYSASEGGSDRFKKDIFYLDYDYENKKLSIHEGYPDSALFYGTIKNKSELKVLMKQLGIS